MYQYSNVVRNVKCNNDDAGNGILNIYWANKIKFALYKSQIHMNLDTTVLPISYEWKV